MYARFAIGLVTFASCGLMLLLGNPRAEAGPIESMAPGTWFEVPNTRMSSVDPCPQRTCSYSGNEGQAGEMDD